MGDLSNGSALQLVRFDQDQAAAYLGKSRAWLERSRWAGTGPVYVKIGRRVEYLQRNLSNYIEAQRRTWTRGPAAVEGSRDG